MNDFADSLKSHIPSGNSPMRRTGIVLSWLAGSGIVGTLIFFVAFLRSNSASGTQAHDVLAYSINRVGLPFGFLILGTEIVALTLLGMGIVRWPSRVIRSPRWVLSAIGTVLVGIAILAIAFLAAMIAVQNP